MKAADSLAEDGTVEKEGAVIQKAALGAVGFDHERSCHSK